MAAVADIVVPYSQTNTQPKKPTILIPPTPPLSSISPTKETMPPTPPQTQTTVTPLTCATELNPSHPLFSITTPSFTGKEEKNPTIVVGVPSDMSFVADILTTMKSTLTALDKTFDSLSEQTAKVATLGPAIAATHHTATLRRKLGDQRTSQEQETSNLEHSLQHACPEQIVDSVKAQVASIIHEHIVKEVKARVSHQLSVQIPQTLRHQVKSHKRQILEIQTQLHNSEARRHNASIRSASLTTPLRPLLRPLPTPAQSPATKASREGWGPTLPPTPASPSMTSTEDTSMTIQLEPPTPSEIFPPDLASLMKLGPDDARKLVEEYGLGVSGRIGGTEKPGESPKSATGKPSPSTTTAGKDQGTKKTGSEDVGHSREEDLNLFMEHIGVPFKMVPPPKSMSKKSRSSEGLVSPLIVSISEA